MAAPETGPGASSPGRANAGEEESDDEWPDVSDHEDEGDATTPIWSSSGSQPGGTSEARPSASATAASATASSASVDLPSHGFHRVHSASAFGPAPDESARAPPAFADAAPASEETSRAGWVESKTGGLGDLFGGNTPSVETDAVSRVGAEAAIGDERVNAAATATAPSPFGDGASGDDDDFFDELASPAKKATPPFGAPPPQNPNPNPNPNSNPNSNQAQHPRTRAVTEAPPAVATALEVTPPNAQAPNPNQNPPQTRNPPAQPAYAAAGQPAYAAQSSAYASQSSSAYGYGAHGDYAPQPAYATQDYAAEASRPARPPPTLLPPAATFSPAAPATFMVPDMAPVSASGTAGTPANAANAAPSATATKDVTKPKPNASAYSVPPAPAEAAPAYDAAPALSAYAYPPDADGANCAQTQTQPAEGYPGYGSGYGSGYSGYSGAPHVVESPYAPSVNDPPAPPPSAPEPAYDHVVDRGSVGAYGVVADPTSDQSTAVAGHVGSFPGSFPGSDAFAHAQAPAAPAAPVAKPTFMIPAAVPAVTEASGRTDAAPTPAPAPALPPLPPPAAPSSGYDFSPLPAAPARAGAAYASYDAGAYGGGFGTYGEAGSYGGDGSYGAGRDGPSSSSSFHADASAGDSPPRGGSPASTAAASFGGSFPEPGKAGPFAAYSAAGSNFTAGDAGTPRSPHGRPPCAVPSFGFGGRLAVSAPGYPGASEGISASSAAPPGHVRVHSLSELLRAGVGSGAARGSPRGPGALYLDALLGLGGEKETFPPLIARNPSVTSLARFAEAVVSQTKDASAAFGSARDPAGDDGAALLWGVLRAMASSRGGGVAGEKAGADPAGAGADVRALLLGEDASGVSPAGPGAETFSPAAAFESSFPATRGDERADDGAGDGSARALAESERLLFSGRRGDALEVLARAGLWAQASLLASRMGAAFQRDVAARAARATTAEGSPMRTLALVLAGAASDLLRCDGGGVPGATDPSHANAARDDARALLPRWREHLAMLSMNASLAPEDSRRVMAALGDALVSESSSRNSDSVTNQKQKQDALCNAHAAFALAGIEPQPFHPAARLCLLGADHTNAPRTYHSDPRAIQATLLLERAVCGASHSGVSSSSSPLGSSVSSSAGLKTHALNANTVCFASFQPYKVLYAGLLAEVGLTREALALLESVSKMLRSREFLATAGARDGSLNVSSLTQLAGEMELRLRGNLRGTLGGLSLQNLGSAATTLFGGFGKMFDKGVQKVFGDEGVPSENAGTLGRLISHSRTHSSASSASNDKTQMHADKTQSARDGDRSLDTFNAFGTGGRQGGAFGVGSGGAAAAAAGSAAHSRSASFASDASASAADPGASPSSGVPKGSSSVWRQFSGVLGKVGAAIPLPKPKNQAKLGEENTMYYDEKLGRWVEPGKEGEADAGQPAPPPTMLGASPLDAGTGHPAPSPGTGASPGTAAAAPFSMRAQKGRSKYVDAFSLSGPASLANHPGGETPGGQHSVFPAGLMPPGVGVSPGLFPPGVPGTFAGGGAPSPPAALMVPSPSNAGFSAGLDEKDTKDLAPLPLSPTAPFGEEKSGDFKTEATFLKRGQEETANSATATAARDPALFSNEGLEPETNEKDEKDSRRTPSNETDPESTAFSFDPKNGPTFSLSPQPEDFSDMSAGNGGRSSPSSSVPPPPVAPMKDLRLTDVPDRDQNRDPVSSFGDGRVDNLVPARFAGDSGGESGKTFFLPGRADATGVVGGGATADDVDDTLDDVDHRYKYEQKVSASESPEYDGTTKNTNADDPFGEGPEPLFESREKDENDQDASEVGFFNREGVWRLGDWPGGERGADGRWHEGYWTQERFWVAGYWDETGQWREGLRPGGYFDADKGWIPENRRDDDDDDARDGNDDRTDRTDRTLGDPGARETTTSAADVADALGGVAGLGFGGEARDDSDEMTEIGL